MQGDISDNGEVEFKIRVSCGFDESHDPVSGGGTVTFDPEAGRNATEPAEYGMVKAIIDGVTRVVSHVDAPTGCSISEVLVEISDVAESVLDAERLELAFNNVSGEEWVDARHTVAFRNPSTFE